VKFHQWVDSSLKTTTHYDTNFTYILIVKIHIYRSYNINIEIPKKKKFNNTKIFTLILKLITLVYYSTNTRNWVTEKYNALAFS